MGWFGPQGNCGCCESGPCDSPGLILDDFTSVHPRWNFLGAAFVDTSKPGIYLESLIAVADYYRCQSLPPIIPGTVIRHKAKILVDYTAPSPGLINPAGYFHGFNFRGTPSAAISPPAMSIFANMDAGVYQTLNYQTALQSSTVPINDSDIVEVILEIGSLVSGTTYNVNAEWVVNSTTIRSESVTKNIGSGGLVNLIGEAFGPVIGQSLQTWTQDFEGGVIPP